MVNVCRLAAVFFAAVPHATTALLRGTSSSSPWNDGPPTEMGTSYPLGRCQGDCDSDADCAGDDLVCDTSRLLGVRRPVPGCAISEDEVTGTDFCVRRIDLERARIRGNVFGREGDDEEDDSSQQQQQQEILFNVTDHGKDPGKMLGMCEGDCDDDSQCSTGYCHKRDGHENIPGCQKGRNARQGHDYCTHERYRPGSYGIGNKGVYDQGETNVTDDDGYPYTDIYDKETDVGTNVTDLDMDTNATDPDLDTNATDPDLDMNATDPDLDTNTTDSNTTESESSEGLPDFQDESGGPLVWIGDDPNTSEAYLKLGLCEGDCDSDYSCEQGLMCWQRNGNSNVPGCQNGGPGDVPTKDYCVPEIYRGTDGDRFFFPANDTFRLKLYWEEGYRWQEESFERRWCLECITGSCDAESRIYISECSLERNVLLEFVPVVDNSTMVVDNSTMVVDNSTMVVDNSTMMDGNSTTVYDNSTTMMEGNNTMVYDNNNSTMIDGNSTMIDGNGTIVFDNNTLVYDNATLVEYHLIKELLGDLCVARDGNAVSWQTCDVLDVDQHWALTTLLGVPVPADASEFEIRPRRHLGGRPKCITQRHHPKDAEWLELEPCDTAAAEGTSLWNKY